jgi:hypothetical protein
MADGTTRRIGGPSKDGSIQGNTPIPSATVTDELTAQMPTNEAKPVFWSEWTVKAECTDGPHQRNCEEPTGFWLFDGTSRCASTGAFAGEGHPLLHEPGVVNS